MSESDPSMSDQVTTWSDTMSDQCKSVIISSEQQLIDYE